MIKNIFKYGFVAVLATVALAACQEEETVPVGEWNATADYANIAFDETSIDIELDPADPKTYTITMSRPDSVGEVTVPVEITNGDSEVISIEPAHFADGEKTADVVFNFPNAEVGKTYTVQFAVSDPRYVSYYSSAATGTFSVTRVKWNDVGFYYNAAGEKVTGWVMYTDDCFTTFYGVQNLSWPTRIQERDDNPGYYRLINTYNDYGYNEPGDWDEDVDHYIFIDATNPNQVYIPEACNTGTHWSYGYCRIWSMVGLGMARGNASYIEGNYGKVEHGKITFPKDALLFSMDGYNNGGWYGSNGSGLFCVVLNPDEDIYVATLNPLGEEGDFEWEEVFDGIFTSNQLGTSDNAKLYKGTCTVSTDQADSTFFADYGTPYVIEAPYAEGYDIYFFVKDGRIQLPRTFESEWLNLSAQPLGFESCGMNTYGQINASSCSFGDIEVILNMTFVTLNKKGEVDQELATNDEVLANITWTRVGTGTYTYFAWDEDEAEPDPGYIWSKRDDKEDVYRIEEWFYGTNLVFTWDKTTNKCHVPEQWCFDHPTLGGVYVCDGPTYHSALADQPVLYDPATKTFKFYLVYYCEAGIFARDVDTFQVEFDESGVKAVSHAKNFKPAKSVTMPWQRKSRWQPKKVQKQSPKTLIAPTTAPVM